MLLVKFVEKNLSQSTSRKTVLFSDIAGRVASRRGLVEPMDWYYHKTPTGQRVFNGVYNQAKESFRNIGGKTLLCQMTQV